MKWVMPHERWHRFQTADAVIRQVMGVIQAAPEGVAAEMKRNRGGP
jgi:hypothetical protein